MCNVKTFNLISHVVKIILKIWLYIISKTFHFYFLSLSNFKIKL